MKIVTFTRQNRRESIVWLNDRANGDIDRAAHLDAGRDCDHRIPTRSRARTVAAGDRSHEPHYVKSRPAVKILRFARGPQHLGCAICESRLQTAHCAAVE